ncbi:MAG: TIGR00341 family protein [Candidatus Baldrarchaeia archaeon]
MKKIELYLTKDSFERAKNLLELWGIRFYYQRMASGENVVYRIDMLIPDEKVDDIIHKLKSYMDFRYLKDMLIITDIEAMVAKGAKKADMTKNMRVRTPLEKLLLIADKYTALDKMKVVLVALAGLVSLVGLLLNNITIIIGAMLLAPILGPIYSFSINSVLGKTKNSIMALLSLFAYIGVVMLASFLMTFVFVSLKHEVPLTEEIIVRTKPNLIYVLMAAMLGFAAILAIVWGVPEMLVGVAIAAAILPSAAVAGISLGILNPIMFLGSLILTLENVFGLLIGALVAPLVLKIAPKEYTEKEIAKMHTARMIVLLMLMTISVIVIDLVFHI